MVHERLWAFMRSSQPSVFADTVEEGVRRVSNTGYIDNVIWRSEYLKWLTKPNGKLHGKHCRETVISQIAKVGLLKGFWHLA